MERYDRLDRIEKTLEVTAEQIKQLRDSQAKTDEQIKQLKDSQAKTDEQIKQLKDSQAKTDEQMKQTDKKIDKISRDIGGGLGRAAEGLVAPSVAGVFKRLGFEVVGINQRIKALNKDTSEVIAEVDIICPAKLNGKKVFLVGEVKAHLMSEDINYFIDEVLVNLRENYAGIFEDLTKEETKVYGFVAGLYVDDAVVRFANKKGLYILLPSGDTMQLANLASFKPKEW